MPGATGATSLRPHPTSSPPARPAATYRRPSPVELLHTEGALLLRTDLAALGLTRTQVDAVFRELDVVVFPGTKRPAVKSEEYRELVRRSTYGKSQVRPT